MFKILVPTDFSANAENALNFAIEIVNRTGGYIQLYHAYTVPSSTGSFISVERYITKDAELELARLVKKIKPRLSSKVILDSKMANGSAIALVCNKAETDDYDLIVMGTQGASGLKGRLFGSNASGIMNRTKVPVLAIPSEVKYQPLDKIVFAVDDNPISDKQVVQMLQRLKKEFSARLFIFHLELPEPVDRGVHHTISNAFKESLFETAKYDSNQNMHKMIDDYAVKNNANLLCMIRRKRGVWHEFLNPSITKSEVGNSSLPLLILHD